MKRSRVARLFSASSQAVLADGLKLETDAKALAAEFKSSVATFKADAAALKVDVKALPKTAANRKLEGAVLRDQAKVLGKLAGGGETLARAAGPAVKRAVAVGVAVLADSSNAAAVAKLRAAVSTIEAKAAVPVTNLITTLEAASATSFTDLTALSAANPTDTVLSADVATTQGHVTDARTSLEADVAEVAADADDGADRLVVTPSTEVAGPCTSFSAPGASPGGVPRRRGFPHASA